MNDSQWLVNKDQVASAIIAHMVAQETAAVAVVPVPPTADCPAGKYKDAAGNCVDIPPTVTVTPVAGKAVWYKRPSTWLIAGGVVVFGGLLIAAARKG